MFGFVIPDSPIKSVYAFPSFLIQATCPAYLNVIDLIVLTLARGAKYAMFSNVLPFLYLASILSTTNLT